MLTVFIILTIATIISQTVHTWYVFNSFSRLSGRLKIFQGIVFCSILSIAIFAFVIIGKHWLALLGAAIEAVINIYYYALDYFENGIKSGSRTDDPQTAKMKRRESIVTWWRKNWIAMFFGLLLPALIYVFANEIINLK